MMCVAFDYTYVACAAGARRARLSATSAVHIHTDAPHRKELRGIFLRATPLRSRRLSAREGFFSDPMENVADAALAEDMAIKLSPDLGGGGGGGGGAGGGGGGGWSGQRKGAMSLPILLGVLRAAGLLRARGEALPCSRVWHHSNNFPPLCSLPVQTVVSYRSHRSQTMLKAAGRSGSLVRVVEATDFRALMYA